MRGPCYTTGAATVKEPRSVRDASAAARPGSGPWPTFVAVRPARTTVAPVWPAPARSAARSARTVFTAILPGILALRRMLPDLLAGVLTLGRCHLPPAFHVSLEALTLLRRHGLIALEALPDLLLLLRGQPLEAPVGRIQFTLALTRQGLIALELLHHAGTIGRRHAAKPLVVLPCLLPLVRREALPLAVVFERALALLGRHRAPLLEIALRESAVFRRQPVEPAHRRITGRSGRLLLGRGRRLGQGDRRRGEAGRERERRKPAARDVRQHVTSPPS